MPSFSRVYWRSAKLGPEMTRHVPPGFTPVTTRRRANAVWNSAMAIHGGLLPHVQRSHFRDLWGAMLDRGLQPSGLLVACLAELPPVIGHSSHTLPRRLARFCTEKTLWCRVPGKLYPHRETAPGHRARAYLILEPKELTTP